MLSKKIEDRVYLDRKITADSIRMGQNANRSEYERWLGSLNPENHRKEDPNREPSSGGRVVVPEGVKVLGDL